MEWKKTVIVPNNNNITKYCIYYTLEELIENVAFSSSL